jgi:hypothetical protein
MEEEGFEVFELGPGVTKKRLHQIDIGFHGPSAIVNGKDHL